MGVMTDRGGESVSTNESITNKQVKLAALRGEILRLKMNLADACAERDGLQVKLDASIPLPLDADGVVIRLGDMVKDGGDATGVEELDLSAIGWKVWLDARGDPASPSDLTHVIPTPKPETIEDVRKAKDNAIAFLAQSGVMGWTDLNTFSSDFAQAFDRAYACGRRDGAGERA